MEDLTMRKIPFRRTAAVAVLFSLMLWTAGCTNYQVVEDWVGDWREHPEAVIRVTTIDGTVYQLHHWKADSLGSVSGKGTVTSLWRQPVDFEGNIPADSIRFVKANREDWRELTESSIRVMTKDGSVYRLDRCKVDSCGTLRGTGTVEVPGHWPTDFEGKIPADSIDVFKADREDWRTNPKPPIRLTMKDGTEYHLGHWRVDSLGTVSGKGTVTRPRDWPADFVGTFPADSISVVKANRTNVIGTAAIVILAVPVAIGSLYLIANGFHPAPSW
jgi:hypothetical protein